MVYTSDLRGKHILRDLHNELLLSLKNTGLEDKIFLRIFDDPKEDDKIWEDGGLTFEDPDTNKTLGSNDAAWFYLEDEKPAPLVIVEATFGTERGQFGDGQFNRFSHPLAPAKLGYIGIMVLPFKGESYSKDGGIAGRNTTFASLKYAYLNKTIAKTALGICQKENGEYLIIDFYNLDLLKELVIEKLKEKFGHKNNLKQILGKIKKLMENYIANAPEPRNKINNLFDKHGNPIKKSFGYIFTQNFPAFTTSSKRDAHGTLGKILSLPYLWPNEQMYSIFLRLPQSQILKLTQRTGKEIAYIFNNPNSIVISRDDLQFDDQELKNKLVAIERINLFQNRQSGLIKKIRQGIESGKIRIKK